MTQLEHLLKCAKENFLNPDIFLEIKDNRLVIEEENNMDKPETLKRLTITNIPDNSFAISFDYSGNKNNLTFKERMIRSSIRKLFIYYGLLALFFLLCSLSLFYFPTESSMFVPFLILTMLFLVGLAIIHANLISHYRNHKLPSPVIFFKLSIVNKVKSILYKCVIPLLDNNLVVLKRNIYGQLSWALSKRNEKINKRCDFIIVTQNFSDETNVEKYMVVLGEMKSKNLGNYPEQLLNSCVFMEYVIKLVNEFNTTPKPHTKRKISANYRLVVISNSEKIRPFETRNIGTPFEFSIENDNLTIEEISVHRVDSHVSDIQNIEDGELSYDKLVPNAVI